MDKAERAESDCKRCSAVKNIRKIKTVKQRKLDASQEADLCTLYLGGTKTAELAKSFNIDQLTVQRTLHRHKIPLRPQKEEIRRYHSEEDRQEAVRRTANAWRERNRSKILEKGRLEGKWKLPSRLGKYGITFEEWKQVLEAQNFCCPICGEPLEFEERYPDTDHCHATGYVRGILHNRCNRLLACARDNVEILQNAIQYLERANQKLQRG